MLRYVACYHDHVRRFDRCHGIEREREDRRQDGSTTSDTESKDTVMKCLPILFYIIF